MSGFDIDNQRIYLYTHSLEAEDAANSGKAVIRSGGIRRPDGTMLDMAKPLSFTLAELKEMVSDNEQLFDAENRIDRLEKEMHLSHEGIQELISIGWINKAATNQLFSMTYAGFQQTLSGLKDISASVDELKQYVGQKDYYDMKEKAERFAAVLGADMQKLKLPNFAVMNSIIDDHINEIGAYIKRMYQALLDGTDNGFFYCAVLKALIGPFSDVLKKYSVLFYYETGDRPDWCIGWIDLIYDISTNPRFKEKLEYHIQLETELSYRDKVAMEKDYISKLKGIYNAVMFDLEYSLYHRKEEYLEMGKNIQKLISLPEAIPEDGKIYL